MEDEKPVGRKRRMKKRWVRGIPVRQPAQNQYHYLLNYVLMAPQLAMGEDPDTGVQARPIVRVERWGHG